jgi:hypothetical protein
MIKQASKTPAYKEPWFWAVMGPLLVVMVVTLSMVAVAVWVADDRVEDSYYKEGRMINKRFAEEEMAMAMGIRGTLEFDFATAEVFAVLEAQELPTELALTLSHPSAAARDVTLIMQRISGARYRADLPPVAEGRWYLIISNNKTAEDVDAWRVSTEVDLRQSHSAHFSAHL